MDKNIIGYVIHEANTGSHDIDIRKKDRDTVVFRAIIQDFLRNRNTRLYDPELLKEGFNASHIKELLAKRAWYGEHDHPFENDIARQSRIVRSNASHLILDYDFYQDRIEATIESTMYAIGKQYRDEILNGHQAAFSLRGLGNVIKTNEGITVTRPFKVITYDDVLLPSHAIAYQTKIISNLNEGRRNFNLNEGFTFSFTSDDFKELYALSENVQMATEQFGDILTSDSNVIINESEIIISANEMKIKMLLEKHLVKGDTYRDFLSSLKR